MKKSLLFLATFLIAASCVQNDSGVVAPATASEDPDWIKLEIPTGRESYAITGDIDKTLLVTTWTKAYYSTDRGKSWQLSKDFQGPVPGLLVRQDTIYALKARAFDKQGNVVGAVNPQYFSTDAGRSWQWIMRYQPFMDDIKPIGLATSSTGVVYAIKQNTTPTVAGSNTAYVNPSEIIRQDNHVGQTVRFPFKHNLINLHLDAQNRLYVAASGGTYQPEKNNFYCCTDEMPAIVYVSKRPMP